MLRDACDKNHISIYYYPPIKLKWNAYLSFVCKNDAAIKYNKVLGRAPCFSNRNQYKRYSIGISMQQVCHKSEFYCYSNHNSQWYQ